MKSEDKANYPEAAGCLGSVPNRAGMSILANQVMLQQLAGGGRVVVVDKGRSAPEDAALEGEFLASGESSWAERATSTLDILQKAFVKAPKYSAKRGRARKPEPFYRQFEKRR